MLDRLRWFKRLVRDLPQQLRLAYCLLRDPRVPIAPRAAVVTAFGLILTPVVDLPAALPLVGELDVLALTLLTLRVFIALCPSEVVAEQEDLIREGRSRFDDDVRAGKRWALLIQSRLRALPRRGGQGGGVTTDGGSEDHGVVETPERRGAVA
jgi:uncharacterized membrane protein YkvA (DUF1232 family)